MINGAKTKTCKTRKTTPPTTSSDFQEVFSIYAQQVFTQSSQTHHIPPVPPCPLAPD